MGPPRATSRADRRLFTVLALSGAALIMAYTVDVGGRHARSVLSDVSLALVFGFAALVLLSSAEPGRPDRRRPVGLFLLSFFFLHLAFLSHELVWPGSIPFGALLGVFLLGVLTKRPGETAAICGVLAGLATVLGVRFGTPIAWTWYVLIGTSVTFGVGVLVGVVPRPAAST